MVAKNTGMTKQQYKHQHLHQRLLQPLMQKPPSLQKHCSQ
jgi:hypothetical protein